MVILYALWNYAAMGKQAAMSGIGSRLDALLSRAKPADLSERQWCLKAGVSTSFFTDVRKGTVPSIDKVERMANAAGQSLAEFVSGGPQKGVNAARLQKAILDAFPLPPLPFDQQAGYLADVVLDILGLPPTQTTSQPNDETPLGAGSATTAPLHGSTRQT